MSGDVRADEHGCVMIPKEQRDRHSEKFRFVELDSGIKLVPIPEEPLEELRSRASGLCEATLDNAEGATQKRHANRLASIYAELDFWLAQLKDDDWPVDRAESHLHEHVADIEVSLTTFRGCHRTLHKGVIFGVEQAEHAVH